jgi:hypothetical protein
MGKQCLLIERITLCGQKSVLLVLIKMVQIITPVLQTVEKARSVNLGKKIWQQN